VYFHWNTFLTSGLAFWPSALKQFQLGRQWHYFEGASKNPIIVIPAPD
jgi:hypothetical protein